MKEYDHQLRLPLTATMLAELDAVVGEGENRLLVIRGAIEREIIRRQRATRTRSI